MTHRNHRLLVLVAMFAVFALAAGVVVGCGSGDEASGGTESESQTIERVTHLDTVFTVEDLRTAGLRANLQYDVEGLTAALDAWRCIFNQKEYEARFYASHDDAVTYGTALADEPTGEDAVLFGDDVTWEPGMNNRKICGHTSIGSAANAGCDAKFADYVIYGNLILLCEGENPELSLIGCQSVIDNLQ